MLVGPGCVSVPDTGLSVCHLSVCPGPAGCLPHHPGRAWGRWGGSSAGNTSARLHQVPKGHRPPALGAASAPPRRPQRPGGPAAPVPAAGPGLPAAPRLWSCPVITRWRREALGRGRRRPGGLGGRRRGRAAARGGRRGGGGRWRSRRGPTAAQWRGRSARKMAAVGRGRPRRPRATHHACVHLPPRAAGPRGKLHAAAPGGAAGNAGSRPPRRASREGGTALPPSELRSLPGWPPGESGSRGGDGRARRYVTHLPRRPAVVPSPRPRGPCGAFYW